MTGLNRSLGVVLAIVACLLLWQAISSYHSQFLSFLWDLFEFGSPIPDWKYLSSPVDVAIAFSEESLSGRLLTATLDTAWHSLSALVLAFLLGALLAEWLKGDGKVAQSFRPILVGLNGIPPVTLLPLALIAFGLGSGSVVAIATYGALLSILFIALRGFRELRQDLEMFVSKMGYSTLGTWLWRLSASSSYLSTALREGFRWSLILSVVAEMHGSIAGGLGEYIDYARLNQDYAQVYVGIISCGILAALCQFILKFTSNVIHRFMITWLTRAS